MSEIPSITALEVEQNSTPFVFEWGGENFTIDAGGIDIRVSSFLRLNDWASALELLLGSDEWTRLLALKVTTSDGRPVPFQWEHANEILNLYAGHVGTTVGKSSASSRSSRRTGTPSKRTSSSTSRRGSRT